MKVVPSGFGLKRKAPSQEESTMEQAISSWEQIRTLDIKDVLDAGKVINLPFPGIDAWVTFLPDSPIVGVPDVQRIREYWNLIGRKEGIMLLGSKGVGKSVRLMIFACIHYATQPKSSRLLCIWNANMPLLSSLKWALIFTYALESNVVQEIDAIDSLEGLAGFISQREVVAKETFSILVDSAQATDCLTWDGQPQRDAEQRQQRWNYLNDFSRGRKVIWSLSPQAQQAQAHHPRNIMKIIIDEGFNAERMQTFMDNNLLGSVLKRNPDRSDDINYYAGSSPWLLDRLDGLCWWCAWHKEEEFSNRLFEDVRSEVNQQAAAALLEDPDLWVTVLRSLEEDIYVKEIENDLKKLKVTKLCYSWAEMVSLDSRYVLNAETGLYCSPYIKHMYIDAVREKEQALIKSQYGAWIGYCRYLLKHNALNWAEVGWACERLCTDVISRTGIRVAEDFVIGHLPTQYYSRIPAIPYLGDGCGIIFIPKKFNFGSVDAVIAYKDTAGQCHFIGLQFTTSEERHKHSEDEFMNVGAVEKWLPSILQLSRDGTWKLHFMFVCLTSKSAELKPERVGMLGRNVFHGVLCHTLHVVSFQYALDVSADVFGVLVEIARRREIQYANHAVASPFPLLPSERLELSEVQLRQLKLEELRRIAVERGLKGSYKTKNSLVEALKAQESLLMDTGASSSQPLPSTMALPLKLSNAQLEKLTTAQLHAIARDGGLSGVYKTRGLLVQAMQSANLLLIE